ncbi:MAG TPA: sigma-70 family RNA polymerase sigma factor [bacterium]
MDKEALIKDYLPFVRAIVCKIKRSIPADISAEDLESHGRVGLVEAAGRYNPALNCSFRTYAYYRVRGAILDALRYDKTLRADSTIQFLGCTNSFLERNIIRESESHSYGSLNEFGETVNSIATIHLLSEHQENEVENKLLNKEKRIWLNKAIGKLPERERTVIKAVYFKDMNLLEIAEELKISVSQISRIHRKGIDRLRKILTARNE